MLEILWVGDPAHGGSSQELAPLRALGIMKPMIRIGVVSAIIRNVLVCNQLNKQGIKPL